MGFNSIGGYLGEPGQIPWEIIAVYFGLALIFVVWYGKKDGGLKNFKTVDFV